jgi:hypothetical protein
MILNPVFVTLIAVGISTVSAVQVLGPVANIPIVNKIIAPDGFPRSYVALLLHTVNTR